MKLIRYVDPSGAERYGQQAPDGAVTELEGDPYHGLRPTARVAQMQRQLAPIAPTQILGVGLNYRRHAEESGARLPDFPVLFLKSLNTVQHPEAPILLPTHLASEEVDYECELAVVIGRTCRNVSAADALDFVLGYTGANDVSARDWQLRRGGGQWSRGKSFDTFCPLGPCLVTTDEIANPNQLRLGTRLNGVVVQDWQTDDMIFPIPELIAFLSGSTTLMPGTVILTGTPHGVGMACHPPRWLREGDVVEVEIEGVGVLRNPVERERP